jgi:tRNA A37 threonylcarbamoyladenosine modification protein TsaB
LACEKPSIPVTSFEVAAYNALGQDEKTLCLVDALHDAYYVCGFDKEKQVIYPPAYLTEEEVLALAKEGYTLVACTNLPLAEKATVTLVDPCAGLEKATKALGEMEKFGELTALYVRKSSAELNRGDGK